MYHKKKKHVRKEDKKLEVNQGNTIIF